MEDRRNKKLITNVRLFKASVDKSLSKHRVLTLTSKNINKNRKVCDVTNSNFSYPRELFSLRDGQSCCDLFCECESSKSVCSYMCVRCVRACVFCTYVCVWVRVLYIWVRVSVCVCVLCICLSVSVCSEHRYLIYLVTTLGLCTKIFIVSFFKLQTYLNQVTEL